MSDLAIVLVEAPLIAVGVVELVVLLLGRIV